ncbi:MAG TPA: NUMOD4 domain-containing protein [Candidatus Nanoarchaeia archaeon]|nr:NUMOD4 domain-containing protein [Candidatus Nanoarchaeia archaeon]
MEQYIKIKDFPSYEVSNLGNIRNLKGKILSPTPDQKGYLMVCLRKDGKSYTKRLARLVAISFISNPLNKSQVNRER